MTPLLSLLLTLTPLWQSYDIEPQSRCSRARALYTVEALSQLGDRAGGTPSGHASAAWVARRLRGLNLSPVVTEDPERWTYEGRAVQLTATADAGRPSEESIELSHAVQFLFSPSSAGEASLAAGLPTTGAYLGARVPRSTETGQLSPSLILIDSGQTWPRERALKAGPVNLTPTISIGQQEGDWIRSCMAEGRELRMAWDLKASIYKARARTVTASLKAREGAPDGFFLIVAHGDSAGGGEGVNGNASGVAVLLEVARAWSAAVREGAIPAPAREVRFAIWGSSVHSASAWMREHRRSSESPLLGVLNLQNLGLSSAGHRLQMEPDDRPANTPFISHACAELTRARGRGGIPERWATNRSRGDRNLGPFHGAPNGGAKAPPAITLYAAGSWEPEELRRTPGRPGESWTDRGLVSIPADPVIHSRGDRGVERITDNGALMEAASRAVLQILPSWLEGLPG